MCAWPDTKAVAGCAYAIHYERGLYNRPQDRLPGARVMSSERLVTVSVIKADIGSIAGHHKVHPDTMAAAARVLAEAKR